jgi:hypothetical protein
LQKENRKRQEICRAIFDETEQLLRVIFRFKDNPVKLETPVYAKFEDQFWLLTEELAKNIRKVYSGIREANELLGRTDSDASFTRNDLWYNYLPNDLTRLQQELREYDELVTVSESDDNISQGLTEPTKMTSQMEWDLFICHASEDKDGIARPLAEALTKRGLRIWYDDFTLKVGDSLRQRIDYGLAHSRYGIVILSPYFFKKNWPQRELDGLAAREDSEGHKVILPVWHLIGQKYVVKYSPTLADRLASNTSDGLEAVVNELLEVVLESAERQPTQGAAGFPSRTTTRTEAQRVDIDSDMQQMFFKYVDDLTASHFKVLEFLDNPREYGERHGVKFGNYVMGGVSTILVEAIPELKGKREFYDQLVKDLHARGLVSADERDIHVTMSETGMFDSRTTETGRKFLAFIKEHA